MGISDYAQGQLTDIVYIELPAVGSKKKAGDVLLTIESVKSAEDVYSPVEGEVIEVNKALTDKPELVNSDSYNYWLAKIDDARIDYMAREIENFASNDYSPKNTIVSDYEFHKPLISRLETLGWGAKSPSDTGI